MKLNNLRAFTLAAIAFLAGSLAAYAGDPNGVWTFQAEAAGRSVDSTLQLQWQNNQLTGTIDNRAGKTGIKDAKFLNDQVSFTVERTIGKRLRKKTFVVHYSGKLEGDTIKGTIETTGRDKAPIAVVWEAHRVK